jgi:Recombination endonuclease VII
MKRCTRCDEEKVEEEFFWLKPFGRRKSQCRSCMREYVRQRYEANPDLRSAHLARGRAYKDKNPEHYRILRSQGQAHRKGYAPLNLSADELRVFLLRHTGICDIVSCKERATDLDHDHVTGKFRGYLCSHHNKGLGMFKDSAEGLRSAANYLEQIS